jgi:hypothetical protein
MILIGHTGYLSSQVCNDFGMFSGGDKVTMYESGA